MTGPRHVAVGDVTFGNDLPIVLIAGPCAMESHNHALETAQILKEITDALGLQFIFKTSFDKANRTSGSSPRGVGLKAALPVFADIRDSIGCPVLTDVHTPEHCAVVADVVDVLQIPAFLCRQTDLLVAAAKTGHAVNIKKGQFLAPWDMVNVASKVSEVGNTNILLTDRGSSFGYNSLVSDMRSLPIMADTGYPVVFDASHSVQQPGGQGAKSGGQREFIPALARAATAVGIAGLFLETHPNPDLAPSDGPNMVPLDKLQGLLRAVLEIDRIAKNPDHQFSIS